MMDRLTQRDGKGRPYFDNDGALIRGANGAFHQKKDMTGQYIHDRFVALDKAIDRLAAYEDTGLEPEEIEDFRGNYRIMAAQFADFKTAQIQGRLVELPCKVGQDVYFLDSGFRNEICPATIVGIEVNGYTPQCPLWLRIEYTSEVIGKHEYLCRADMMLGKTVFLSRTDAESVLEERNTPKPLEVEG